MIDHLPERLDLLEAAETGRVLQGRIALVKLERVVPLLATSAGDLEVRLELGKDTDGTLFLQGKISGTVSLQCQRCLEPMALPLKLRFRLGIVTGHEAAGCLHERYEPLLAGSEPALIADIVSDEVLLGLPLVAVHEEGNACRSFLQNYHPPGQAKQDNPFAVLASMKPKNPISRS